MNDELEPIVDEVDQAWGRFSNGQEASGASRTVNPLEVLAAALAGAAAIAVIAAIVETFGFNGASIRDRAVVASLDGASIVTAGLALAAIGVVFALGIENRGRAGRWALTCGSVVSAVVIVGVVYRLGYIALVHPHVNASDFPSQAALRAEAATFDWPTRLQLMLVAAAAGLLAGAALYVARCDSPPQASPPTAATR
jgi:hypothetical protein